MEKSRRIGLSWADAADATLCAAMQWGQGMDTWYIGYNKDMAEQYVKDAAFWAKAFNLAATEVEESVLEDEDQDILIFRIRFASGYNVTALSSRPANLRAKKGRIVIDEAAFHEDLPGLMKAAIAILMWGGRVAVISTHDGVDNYFNRLIQSAEEFGYSHHKITLDDALADGLYRRICLVEGKSWTVEGEFAWRSQLYKEYGVDAAEELDCQPYQPGAGKVFNRDWFQVIDSAPAGGQEVRFWDMAATAKELNKDACYTSGVKMKRIGDRIYVLDVIAEQMGPSEGDALIVKTAKQDGRFCKVRWELEGGSSGKKVEANLQSQLQSFDAAGIRPMGDKLTRAKPFASEAMRGNVFLIRANWNDQYLSWLNAFDGMSGKSKVNDPIDASSGAYQEVMTLESRQIRQGSVSWG